MTKKYNCEIYNFKKAFVYIFLIITLSLGIIGLLAVRFSLVFFFPLGLICLLILPYIFKKRIKSLFTNRVLLDFSDEHFSASIYRSENDNAKSKIIFTWDYIKSYKFYFTPNKLTYLSLKLKNGITREIGLKDGTNEEEPIRNESILSVFRLFVKQYNLDQQHSDKIILAKGF